MEMRNTIGHERRGGPGYISAENWSELCSVVGWQVELVSDECGYLAEKVTNKMQVFP